MRVFMRPRYGCDHCKKIGGSKRHMAKHEAGCTNNPNRVCRLHEFAAPGEDAPDVQTLLDALAAGGWPKLVEVSHNCPACKLAALRQSLEPPEPGEGAAPMVGDGRDEFDFRAEVAAVWADHNDVERDY